MSLQESLISKLRKVRSSPAEPLNLAEQLSPKKLAAVYERIVNYKKNLTSDSSPMSSSSSSTSSSPKTKKAKRTLSSSSISSSPKRAKTSRGGKRNHRKSKKSF